MKYTVKISISAKDANEAKKAGQLLQNIADRTDSSTKDYLHSQVAKNPDYFKSIATKLKNPIIQKMLGKAS